MAIGAALGYHHWLLQPPSIGSSKSATVKRAPAELLLFDRFPFFFIQGSRFPPAILTFTFPISSTAYPLAII